MKILEEVPYSKHIVLNSNIGNLLLIFTNLKMTDKKENVVKLHELEMSLDERVKFGKRELRFLNNQILKRRFIIAIITSEVYKILYNTNFIKQLYRKRHES